MDEVLMSFDRIKKNKHCALWLRPKTKGIDLFENTHLFIVFIALIQFDYRNLRQN